MTQINKLAWRNILSAMSQYFSKSLFLENWDYAIAVTFKFSCLWRDHLFFMQPVETMKTLLHSVRFFGLIENIWIYINIMRLGKIDICQLYFSYFKIKSMSFT